MENQQLAAGGPPYEFRRATRATDAVVLGGVAAGLARHLGISVLTVRVAFLVFGILGGLGVALYAGLWMVLPTDARFSGEAAGLQGAARSGKRPTSRRGVADLGPIIALAALALGLVLLVEGLFGRGAVVWPVVLAGGGVALLWRQADEAQRERWVDSTSRLNLLGAVFGNGGWAAYARVGAGVVLFGLALGWFAFQSGPGTVARDVLLAGLLGVAGLAVIIGPWLYRLTSDLGAEREERVRSQERADLAAHLHDSVLQTLALIQKNSHDGPTVARLARLQERDLRSWLYAGEAINDETLAAAVRRVAADVENAHSVVVDVVNVGDRDMTESLLALVRACGEAVTNAAKHAGTGRVDVYVEVLPDRAEVFVRDRGAGFDIDAIAADRHGVKDSIIDRMRRHGGRAQVRSEPGEGTEVRLYMPIEPAEDSGRDEGENA